MVNNIQKATFYWNQPLLAAYIAEVLAKFNWEKRFG